MKHIRFNTANCYVLLLCDGGTIITGTQETFIQVIF